MTKRSPAAVGAVRRVPDGSGVRLKSRLRRYSASLRGERGKAAVLRFFAEVFALRAGIGRPRRQRAKSKLILPRRDIERREESGRLRALACPAGNLLLCWLRMLFAALDR